MQEKFLTIFTPTYNRAYILPKLYESLLQQSNKNFVWLVGDDGSSDKTKDLVQQFQAEGKLEITYFFQENKGKHFAVNRGLEIAVTEFFSVVDSDDYLSENAVEEMQVLSEKIQSDQQIAAFTFIHFSGSKDMDLEKFGKKEWIVSGRADYDWQFPGEMTYCFKTKIHREFLFPEFEGEKFCQESLVFRRIERKYKILFTDKILAFGDYLEDGLTNNFYQLLLKNPKSTLLNIRERFQDPISADERSRLAETYWDIASKTDTSFMEKYLGINPFLILKVLLKKYTK